MTRGIPGWNLGRVLPCHITSETAAQLSSLWGVRASAQTAALETLPFSGSVVGALAVRLPVGRALLRVEQPSNGVVTNR